MMMKTKLVIMAALLCCCLPFTLAQTEARFSLSFTDEPLAEVLKQVERVSDYHILFTYEDVEPYRVTVELREATVTEAMSLLLEGKPLNHSKRGGKYIIIKHAPAPKPAATDTPHQVTGKVVDKKGSPVDAAVVTWMDASTDSVMTQTITDANGRFSARISGTVRVLVGCLGYQQHVSAPAVIAQDVAWPEIRLQEEDYRLEDVVVVGEKQTPSLRIERGKMIYTPKNSSIVAGSSALEMLKKTPGVFVDGNNSISIGGKSSVLIILNGKPTYMQQEELIALLKSTPSSSISSIEVINNPSAQYDAEGSGGVININMEQKKTEGFFLSLNNGLSYWEHIRQNTELSFSYAREKLNVSGNYNHAVGYYNMDYGMRRIQSGKEYNSPTKDTEKRKTISGNLSMEYKFDDKHLLGGRLEVNTLFGPGQTNTVTEIRDHQTMQLEQVLYAQNDYYKQKGNRYGGNAYYVFTPQEGISYTLDANYAWFDGGSGNWQPNTYCVPDGTVLQNHLYKSVNGRNIHIYAVSFNQQHRGVAGGELKSGLKYSMVDADNDYRFYEVAGNQETIDEGQSNDFAYKEQIMAAYLLYSRNLGKKVSMEVGLRGEYTLSDGKLYTVGGDGDEQHSRDYFNLFPSLSLNYQPNEEHALALSYGSRIDRPAYQDLNPFEYLLDELSYWKGNPFLIPQKIHRISATYSHKRTACTVSYAYMKDYKAQITDTLSTDKVVMTSRNIGKQQRVSLNLYQGWDIASWWEMNLNLIGYYVKNDIAFDEHRLFNLDSFAGILSVQNTVRLPWKVQMELNGSYATKRLGASNERMRPTGYVDIGFSRSFSRKRLMVQLAMSDVFWNSNWDSHSSFDGFQLWNWGKGESRQLKLNVTYRFGKEKRSSHSSSFEEIDRL